jgi:uncharacterized protein (TIGR03086 family)
MAVTIRGIRDDQLDTRTPCGGITVGALLDHVDSLCVAFAAAGAKQRLADGGQAPAPDASRLGADWRDRIPARLDTLADGWRAAAAWEGMTQVGGGEMPARIAGAAAIDEVLVHGWDLAAATGHGFPGDGPALAETVAAAYAWAQSVVEQNPGGTPGLFGPPVKVAEDAPAFSRLLGLTGRDPGWELGAQ